MDFKDVEMQSNRDRKEDYDVHDAYGALIQLQDVVQHLREDFEAQRKQDDINHRQMLSMFDRTLSQINAVPEDTKILTLKSLDEKVRILVDTASLSKAQQENIIKRLNEVLNNISTTNQKFAKMDNSLEKLVLYEAGFIVFLLCILGYFAWH